MMNRLQKMTCGLGLSLLVGGASLAQTPNLGIFEGHNDLGAVQKSGNAVYNASTHYYELASQGKTHFVWKRMKGDFLLYARTTFLGKGTDPNRQAGWLVRTNLDEKAVQVAAVRHGNGQVTLQYRKTIGGNTTDVQANTRQADVIQLERKGKTITMRVAKFGEPFRTEQVNDLDLGEEVYVGLFVGGQRNAAMERATFQDVRISVPAHDGLVPYREYLASNLEILDVATGNRQVIHTVPKSIQAPNWTPDGKTLLYNGDGLIYTLDLATRQQTLLSTGEVKNNNNDHVLSFDGKMLGLSSGVKELGGSIIYTVPVSGGIPKQITPIGPSYLHGWSPDSRNLVFTGSRNGEFDIYRVPAEGGPEVRLTDAKGLDDGPEYTPDGKYI